MAIRDTEREENVEGSILRWAQEKLVDTEELAADIWEAHGFDSSSVDEWVEVRVLLTAAKQDFRLINTQGDRGQDALILVNINLYVKRVEEQVKPARGNARAHLKLVDRVAQHFRQGTKIPVYQLHEGGDPTVQVEELFCMRLDKTAQVSSGQQTERAEREGLLWRNMTATFRYTREIAQS